MARILIAVLILLLGARSIASYVIEFAWWKELGQLETWLDMLGYQLVPVIAASLLAFAVLWLAHARGLKFAGVRLRDQPRYSKLATILLLGLGIFLSAASLDAWTLVRYWGARGLPAEATAWHDPVFGQPLSFYLFDLPFYSDLRGYLLTLTAAAAILYWLTARGWQLRHQLPDLRNATEIDASIFRLEGGLESAFLRGAGVVFAVALAVRYYLGRYEMVWNDHGFMVGIDYINDHFTLPLQWAVIAACLAAAAGFLLRRWLVLALVPVALLLQAVVPSLAGFLYVRANEISLQREYIQHHIQATRAAYGLDTRVRQIEFKAKPDSRFDPAQHKVLLDNVRLWDWRAFHDTVTQIQALRTYYTFADSDVDRYMIDGQYRQVLLTPRELDIRQLPDARTRWINPHFIYTHGYGMVLAEVSKITSDGLPKLLIQDAPPLVKTASLKLTRPEIYYGEVVHEPVFVHTAQKEFNYPSGDTNVQSSYEGKGGFPISSLPMRIAAALREGELNIILTGYLTPDSRMMIRRNVRQRLEAMADFLKWDTDPYLVITESGRLVWMVDGYTTSAAHPYSQRVRSAAGLGTINYVRNAVKATVDAYDGDVRLYVFDPGDPIIRAWQKLFPKLFRPASEMPPDLRAHTRYPETLFRVQAEIYRIFHMQDPQAFYNKEDAWDLARHAGGPNEQPKAVSPTYVVASLPGSDKPEFLLLVPFTPRSKDNMIGLMVGHCDGDQLGKLTVLQLSKQELIAGPMQIAAKINQDQNISKDLTLWNQQGSQVLRGQTLVLPIESTFLYVEPIYIQSTDTRMPQLKKVVLAEGNTLIYADTYEDALAQLTGTARAVAKEAVTSAAAAPAASPSGSADPRLDKIRGHLKRYRELSSQGKWAEAGKELEAIEAEARR
ncbi:MAG: UPF0182 family protein [Acidobacteria bacterium]|nr:UPF0182 family protein [Acidobacteriota bacterium]